MDNFTLELNHSNGLALSEQIRLGIGTAIREGRLYSGARLPSWRDLAAQLGVSRGTVRTAYERLIDEQLIVSRGAAGTFVNEQILPVAPVEINTRALRSPLPNFFLEFDVVPMPFQMGVPAYDAFPYKTWSRTLHWAARTAAERPTNYPDPRGEYALRREIAAYLSVSRGLTCVPSQVLITSGYTGALGLAINALKLWNTEAWVEEPGFPLTRIALSMANVKTVSVPVDDQGLIVSAGIHAAPSAAFAIVTAGQQAPLGMTLSLARRHELLEWANSSNAWIIEDDYLSELQLMGRAAPALASLDKNSRVIHIGTFSKTITPSLRLGFMVVPLAVANYFGDVAAALNPVSNIVTQFAVAEFMRSGQYLRHLRRMKRLYGARSEALRKLLNQNNLVADAMAGLAIHLHLPSGVRDTDLAKKCLEHGLAPAPLSVWYENSTHAKTRLLLGVTNLQDAELEKYCAQLAMIIRGIAEE